jgi:hypothetical protein
MFTRRRLIISLIIGLLVVGVAVTARSLTPADCPIIPATQQDFDEAIIIGNGIFEPEIWELKSGEHPALISVGWFSRSSDAFSHSQYLLYNCGYTQADLDRFYSDGNWNIMLDGYEAWTRNDTCKKDGIILHEFSMTYVGKPMIMRFWIFPVNEKRVRDIQLTFSANDPELMEKYAARLFPNFTSCAAV